MQSVYDVVRSRDGLGVGLMRGGEWRARRVCGRASERVLGMAIARGVSRGALLGVELPADSLDGCEVRD